MCGITGFFDHKNVSNVNHIQLMMDCQSHRGPDAEGMFFETMDNCQVALGHRRLSIIDISDQANQPMRFANLTIVYNGEVYNFSEIKSQLEACGYTFDTDGDTEVVLKAFHKWGIQSVNKFRGMFSFCILDRNAKKAYLVRDRAGVKPLYYYHDGQTFLFSSELKSFRHHPAFKSTLCEHGLNLFFQYGYINAPWTIFSGTKKVHPGHYVEYDISSNTFFEEKYWDLSSYYLMPKLPLNEHEAIEQLESLLTDSFSLRMISDMPVGVLLSGGIDSSLVAAILQSNSSQSIETFTMGFQSHQFDESSHARKIAKHLGTQHHERVCTWKDAESIINHLPKIYSEPFADSSAIPTALIAQFVRQKVSVVLSGDGGDELFCGYDSYLLNRNRFNMLNKIPFKKRLGKILNFIPDPVMSLYRMNFDLYNRYLKLKSTFSHDHLEDKYKSITRTFSSHELTRLFSSSQSYTMTCSVLHELDDLERMMLIDFNHYLSDDLLVKVDRATMYFSLEGREPLLDHKILEFAAQLPIQLKMKKDILKKILGKYIPPTLFERKKQGFGVPVNEWLKNELKYLVNKYLDTAKLKKQGIFNHQYVAALCRAFFYSKTNDSKIWTLLTFQMWYEEYLGETF